mgnify:FL=1|tara:strand:+ start:218 stop:409 length:192 start_codon:yes stop_codon:yes gene_type:complete
MPKRTKQDALGWPTHIKCAKEREKSIAKKMNGQKFEDVVLKKGRENVVIDWNVAKKIKRKPLW